MPVSDQIWKARLKRSIVARQVAKTIELRDLEVRDSLDAVQDIGKRRIEFNIEGNQVVVCLGVDCQGEQVWLSELKLLDLAINEDDWVLLLVRGLELMKLPFQGLCIPKLVREDLYAKVDEEKEEKEDAEDMWPDVYTFIVAWAETLADRPVIIVIDAIAPLDVGVVDLVRICLLSRADVRPDTIRNFRKLIFYRVRYAGCHLLGLCDDFIEFRRFIGAGYRGPSVIYLKSLNLLLIF